MTEMIGVAIKMSRDEKKSEKKPCRFKELNIFVLQIFLEKNSVYSCTQ